MLMGALVAPFLMLIPNLILPYTPLSLVLYASRLTLYQKTQDLSRGLGEGILIRSLRPIEISYISIPYVSIHEKTLTFAKVRDKLKG